jgi:hypothetical protein
MQPNRKFEVPTPNAIVGVIGTEYGGNRTRAICYIGRASVAPLGKARVSQSNSSSSASSAVTVVAGQMVEITSEVPPGRYHSQPKPSEVQRASMDATEVPDLPAAVAVGVAHPWRWALLFGGFGGVATGLVFAVDRGGFGTPQQIPIPNCPLGVPTQPGYKSPEGM